MDLESQARANIDGADVSASQLRDLADGLCDTGRVALVNQTLASVAHRRARGALAPGGARRAGHDRAARPISCSTTLAGYLARCVRGLGRNGAETGAKQAVAKPRGAG
jgi:hypothetical protein